MSFAILSPHEPSHDCPLCPRLHDFIADWRARAHVVQRAGSDLPAAGRRRLGPAADRRPGAGPARRQPDRPALHRRLCRRPALPRRSGDSASPAATSRRGPTMGCELVGTAITNAVRCVPPENKPTPAEINTCRQFLTADDRTVSQSACHRDAGRHRAPVDRQGARRQALGAAVPPRRTTRDRRRDAFLQLPLLALQHEYRSTDRRDVRQRVCKRFELPERIVASPASVPSWAS